MKTRLNLTATGITSFPAQPWLTEVRYDRSPSATGSINFNGKILYRHTIYYKSCGRDRRVIVVAPTMKPSTITNGSVQQGTKPVMVVCLPGSNNNSDGDNNGLNDGAWDLTENIGAGELQFQYPLHLVADHDVYAVLIDGPQFGAFNYPDMTAAESLVDDICGVEAARFFLSEHGSFPIYGMQSPKHNLAVIGLSWGGARAQFLISALMDCVLGYVAGAGISKEYDQRELFNPADWPSGFDYKDMLLASKVHKCRHMFGGNGQDYLYTPFSTGNANDELKLYQPPTGPARYVPNADRILSQLANSPGGRFDTVVVPGVGHQIDLNNLKTWFAANVGYIVHNLPEYVA